MTTRPSDELVPMPLQGRIFPGQRRVRLGDASSNGRLRLDACAEYLQDIANDDSRDAGSENPTAWVARRTVLQVERFPHYLELLEMWTWCGGIGPRWAERRYSVRGDSQASGMIEAATLWVHIDMQTMKPISVPTDFSDQFAEAAQGRKVSARLHLVGAPAKLPDRVELWPLRAVDFDVLGHVNNAVYWAMVEQELHRRGHREQPLTVTLEHHEAIEFNASVRVAVCDTDTGFDIWVTTGEQRLAAAVSATMRP